MEIDIDELYEQEPDELEKHFDDIQTIGKGAFGTVYKGIDKNSKKQCAIKVINIEGKKRSVIQKMKNEILILKSLNHVNIVKFIGYIETKQRLYIIMEFIKYGTLKTWMNENKDNINEEQASTIIKYILKTVQYLHSNNIYHRDIKPENIMLSKKNDLTSIKLIDFGLSSMLMFNIYEDSEYCGTFLYMAPEQIEKKLYFNSVDIWSIGIIMYMLLNKCKHPYFTKGITRTDYIQTIKQNKVNMIYKCSPMAFDLNNKLLEVDPKFRYTADKALRHPWITRNTNDPIPETLKQSLKNRIIISKMKKTILSMIFLNHLNKRFKDKKYYITDTYKQRTKKYSDIYNKIKQKIKQNSLNTTYDYKKDLPIIDEINNIKKKEYKSKDSSKKLFKFSSKRLNIYNFNILKNIKKTPESGRKSINKYEAYTSNNKFSKTIKKIPKHISLNFEIKSKSPIKVISTNENKITNFPYLSEKIIKEKSVNTINKKRYSLNNQYMSDRLKNKIKNISIASINVPLVLPKINNKVRNSQSISYTHF